MNMEKKFILSRNGIDVLCRQTEPDFGDIRRVVLGVHGIGGNSTDAIQVGIAEEMEMFYSATLRFDLPCHAESPVDDFTIRNCMDSLLAVAEYAREQYPEVEDLCIFATGFGAYLVLITLDDLLRMPGKLKLVVQTPSVVMHDTILAMRNVTEPTLKAMGVTTFTKPGWRSLPITYECYQEMRDNIALNSYDIPMLILHGEEDRYIKSEHIQQFHRINEESKLVIIPGTSHRFLEEGAWDMVLDLTRDWFEFEQVLCCDYE